MDKNRQPKHLVPPLEISKRIPQGSFTDSFFCWVEYYKEGWIRSWRNITVSYDEQFIITPRFSAESLKFHRRESTQDIIPAVFYPAPTLQEILDALTESGNCFVRRDETGWMTMLEIPGDEEGYGYDPKVERDKENPATAALKLYLELNSIPSIPGIPIQRS